MEQAKKMYSKLGLEQNKSTTIKYIAYAAVTILIIGLFTYTAGKMRLNTANCTNLKNIYTSFPKISSINFNDNAYSYNLRDYYVKTAYNCCSSGQFKNDYVNECALKTCISQGARVLDFEIYSVGDEPVIAASSIDNNHVKETYNSVKFSDAMNIIRNYAFSGGSCPNPNDPLVLHFRISSNNEKIYKKMADSIFTNLENRILDKIYSYEYYGHNLGAIPLKEFQGKVIISVDRANPLFTSTPLDEYVNIASNSMFLRASRDYNIKYTPDSQELINYNKKNMTLSMPDLSAFDTNASAALNFKYGCQWVGMCFQNFDSNMEYYDLFFDKTGHAFVLKPEHLRFVPITIPEPIPQKPENSFAKRSTSTDYYSFSI
ncbi:phosphatidylinositol-specific phospholipase C domain-containing protein [Flavobacteriaceae bacterium]|nr:phosphatidylinositol-specific phospholipase C domain-containing protein [Flavobacteriaceae bacterium]